MKLVKKVSEYLERKRELPFKVSSLKMLTEDQNPMVRNIGQSLIETVNGNFSPEEKDVFRKIEMFRSNLLSSKDNINILDYGAGRSVDQRTGEEMFQGVTVSKSISTICRTASKPAPWAQVLYKIISCTKVKKCLELGTCFGISGLYQASALKLNGFGVLKTMEGSTEIAEIAKRNFSSLGLNNISLVVGRFQDNLDDLLKEKNFDYAFIDGHHDKDATINYFDKIYQSFASQGIFIFDDINWSDGMEMAWETIKADKRINVSIDLGAIGVCVIDKNSTMKREYKF